MTREKIKVRGNRVEFQAGEWTHDQPLLDFLEIHFDVDYIEPTCESCKHISEVHPTECTYTANYTFDWMEIPEGFSCNRWENKDD